MFVNIHRNGAMGVPPKCTRRIVHHHTKMGKIMADLFEKKIIFDLECYPSLFVLSALSLETGEMRSFTSPRDAYEYVRANGDALFIGYNSNAYDDHIINFILGVNGECTASDVREISDALINDGIPVRINRFRSYDAYDPIEAGMRSLKMFCGSYGHTTYDSPYSFKDEREYTPAEVKEIVGYCEQDVYYTRDVFNNEFGYYEAACARVPVLQEYGISFDDPRRVVCCRSAALARNVFSAMCTNGRSPKDDARTTIKFAIDYTTREGIGDAYAFYRSIVENGDELSSKEEFYNKETPIVRLLDGLEVALGWGGAHGAIEGYVKPAGVKILYADVSSMYPTLMIMHDFYPYTFTPYARGLYEFLYHSRLTYKKQGEKLKSQAAKRLIASLTGMLKDKFAVFRSEWANNSITINGQLSVTDLAYQLSKHFRIVQVNTDGVMAEVKAGEEETFRRIVDEWCVLYKYEVSSHEVQELVQLNVNNYYMVDEEGVTVKGASFSLNRDYFNDKAVCKKALPLSVVRKCDPLEIMQDINDIRDYLILIKTTDTFPYLYDTLSGECTESRCIRCIAARPNGELAKLAGVRFVNYVKMRSSKDKSNTQKVSDFPTCAVELPDDLSTYDSALLLQLLDKDFYAQKVRTLAQPFQEKKEDVRCLFELDLSSVQTSPKPLPYPTGAHTTAFAFDRVRR